MNTRSPLPHQGEFTQEPGRSSRYKRPDGSRRNGEARYRSSAVGRQLSFEFGAGRTNGCATRGTQRGRGSIATVSVRRVRPFLPAGSEPFITRLLREVPTEIVPVQTRESKHGDFTKERGRPYGRITVNVCGNRYRFLLTLVHELAHARVVALHRRRVRPHGQEWKDEFARLLFRLLRYQVLPARLRRAVYLHALDPKSTDEYDTELQLALRRYDTSDKRLTVAELQEGTRFSLDGKLVLRRGKLIRRRIQCVGSRGQIFSVLPAARVDIVFE